MPPYRKKNGQAAAPLQAAFSEAELRAVLAAIRDLVLIIGSDGVYRKIAPTNPDLLVLPAAQLLGRTLADVFPAGQAAEFLAATRRSLLTGEQVAIEYELSIRGEAHWFAASITRLDEDAAVWVVREITERKQADLEKSRLLLESQQRLKRVEALRAIDLAINAVMDLRLTLSILLAQSRLQLGVDAARVLLVDARTYAVDYAAGEGFRSTAIERRQVRLEEGLAGRVVRQRGLVRASAPPGEEAGAASTPWAAEGFSAYIGLPLIAKGEIKGVLEIYHRSPLDPGPEWLEFLETLAGQAAIAIHNAQLLENARQASAELRLAYDATIEGWSRALDLRDKETEGHTRRVIDLTLALARRMGVSEAALVHIRRGALLHDIGKMGIPDRILLKPGKLTPEEWEVMRQHPQFAYEMLSSVEYLRPALEIPYGHHEKWDGSGYPRGLRGEQIPLAARIFAVVDVWDALTSNRPYRPALSRDEALLIIREQAGLHFDPAVVREFLSLLSEAEI